MSEELRTVVGERRRLVALAYRMLGTMAEAEDAVQETYTRWYRLSEEERDAVANVPGWLTRVASNVCLDVLKSARLRREQYVGPWLPEPLPAAARGLAGATGSADPADRITLDESVSTALLVVLDAMTPAERVAFVLHDVFEVPFPDVAEVVGRSPAAVRQLATSARRRVQAAREGAAPTAEHAAVVRAFLAACEGGELGALMEVLAPTVELRSDGGGVVRAARNPIVGASKVARFLLGVIEKQATWRLGLTETGDGLAVAFLDGERVAGVVNVRVEDARVRDVWIVLNPEKLTRWA
ncbi:MAG TPA: RNA polymerase sigma factor SigJ [Nocardioides sp.]|nr:RNA polymerase sigma factor SigJ [Nocardioides sp.]